MANNNLLKNPFSQPSRSRNPFELQTHLSSVLLIIAYIQVLGWHVCFIRNPSDFFTKVKLERFWQIILAYPILNLYVLLERMLSSDPINLIILGKTND